MVTLYVLLQTKYAGRSPVVTAVLTDQGLAQDWLAFDPDYRRVELVMGLNNSKEVAHIREDKELLINKGV